MSQHTSPLQPTPEQAPHGLPPQDARVFEFPSGQELHKGSTQTGVEAPYDWANESELGTPKEKHIGTISSSLIDLGSREVAPRIPQEDTTARMLGRVANAYERTKATLGLTPVPAPKESWNTGKNQLDYLPKSLRKPR